MAKAVPILTRIPGLKISILAPTRHKYFSWPMYACLLLAQQPPVCQGLLIHQVSRSDITKTTVGRTPLDKWSARYRDLYLTTHNTHKHPWFDLQQVQMCIIPPGRLEAMGTLGGGKTARPWRLPLLSSVEVKDDYSYTSTPTYTFKPLPLPLQYMGYKWHLNSYHRRFLHIIVYLSVTKKPIIWCYRFWATHSFLNKYYIIIP